MHGDARAALGDTSAQVMSNALLPVTGFLAAVCPGMSGRWWYAVAGMISGLLLPKTCQNVRLEQSGGKVLLPSCARIMSLV